MAKKCCRQNNKDSADKFPENAQNEFPNSNPTQNHNIKKEASGPNTKR